MMPRLLTTLAALSLISACTSNPYTGERQASNTGKGAAMGAAIGAVIGAITGDDADERRKRALVGAGAGALAGTAVGAYMDKQEALLRQQLANSGVSVTRMGDDLVLNMPGNITFDVNKSLLRTDFFEVLDSVSLALQEFDRTLVDVTGHTDSTGSLDYNMTLSEERAISVATYLRLQGVDANRMHTQGAGPQYPVASNATSEGRSQNRRVELVLKPLT